jgi:hypothetical protein
MYAWCFFCFVVGALLSVHSPAGLQQGISLIKPVLITACFGMQNHTLMDQIIESCIGITQRRMLEVEAPIRRCRYLLNGLAGCCCRLSDQLNAWGVVTIWDLND